MATVLTKTSPEVEPLALAHNQLKAQIGAGAFFHLDKCEASVTAPSATDLATSLVRLTQVIGLARFHFGDTLAHKVADVTALPAVSDPQALASAITAANALKAAYNTHIASTTYHYNADATNATASANASDQATLNTLVNELYTDLTAHVASGPSAPSLRVT